MFRFLITAFKNKRFTWSFIFFTRNSDVKRFVTLIIINAFQQSFLHEILFFHVKFIQIYFMTIICFFFDSILHISCLTWSRCHENKNKLKITNSHFSLIFCLFFLLAWKMVFFMFFFESICFDCAKLLARNESQSCDKVANHYDYCADINKSCLDINLIAHFLFWLIMKQMSNHACSALNILFWRKWNYQDSHESFFFWWGVG